ncbi:MAG TPA: aminotransferase class V-fold PLP-dependent enzyme [Caulobacteraceae bacterium]|nr:aminotransferase class V-fold PLP-dependent enzyme [Caulobacteraceae bacterium]
MDRLRALDACDPLAGFRDRFDLPEGVIYLAGNSLGPPPKAAAARMAEVVRAEWGGDLVGAWTRRDWIGAPARVGAKIAPLIGAKADEVIVADSTSVDLYKLLVAALKARPERRTVLTVREDFPTDLYVAGAAARVRQVDRRELIAALDQGVAVVVLTHAHYRSAEVWDMAAVNAAASAAGAWTLWDLSHSAGVVEVDLDGSGADLAVGCGYKYLNGGPGAPAWLYVSEQLQSLLETPIAGWMGHVAPFDFAGDYRPAEGVRRFLAGTPPILSLLALETAIDAMAGAEPAAMAAKARRLGDLFLELMADLCPELEPACPGPGRMRGGHVAFRHAQAQAFSGVLAAEGLICDVRPPDLLRFGLSPLYIRYEDAGRAVQLIRRALDAAAIGFA